MRYFTLLLMICASAFASGQTYITNVTVMDVEKMKAVPAQTVVVSGDRITAVGPVKKINVPAGATVIDGSGKYLMPGLVDAHVHFFQSGGLYTRPDALDFRKHRPYKQEIEWTHGNMEDFLRRYTRAGITTVIDVGATVNFLRQRDSFRTRSYAPAVYMTGPLLTTWEPPVFKNLHDDGPFVEMKTEEDARKYVQQQLPFRPDFIKIWYIVNDRNIEAGARKLLPLVQAVINEAHSHNLRVAVHATERITAQLAVEAGCDFLVHGIDDEPVSDEFVQLLKKKNVVLCPTLVVAGNYNEVYGQQYKLSYTDYTSANPQTLGSLFDLRHLPDTAMIGAVRKAIRGRTGMAEKTYALLTANTKKLADGGVVIATGTDAGNVGTLHASSYFEELQAMQHTGFTPWQLLQASTINGAKAMGKEKSFGSIQTGKLADMLLLDANPLDSIANWQRIAYVINKGNVIRPDTLVRETPLALVQRQLNAYNGHNLEAFLEPYADSVEIYQFPAKLQMKGKEAMRKAYGFITNTPALHCEIQKRIIQGNIVIDHERVQFGNGTAEAIAIYHIEHGKISKVYFVY